MVRSISRTVIKRTRALAAPQTAAKYAEKRTELPHRTRKSERERSLLDKLRGVPICQRCRRWPSDVTAPLFLFVCACVSMIYTIHLFLPSPLFLTPPALRFLFLLPLILSASPHTRGHTPTYDLVLSSFLNAQCGEVTSPPVLDYCPLYPYNEIQLPHLISRVASA